MERGCSEEEYRYKCNKMDLTLKLSPWGENAEERGLRRSSSLVGSEAQWGPSLDRSCSLPSEPERMVGERQRRVAALSPQVLAWVAASAGNVNVNVNTPPLHKPKEPSSLDSSELEGPRNSAKGSGSNIPSSIKQENDSMVSRKTMAKEIPARPCDTKLENPAKRLKLGNYCSLKGDVMEILRQMPSVTTTGDGPNGKRIEGFLYKYRSGQVCIVCVCHGSFLTPAEFVMHAGGKEVANPMKHITVFSNSF